ncbi:Zinc dependent phospholipase C [Sporobacter termitidis DSM 10068]|uniref:Zinc dependent phospholipase C n=1 Tax=Sporobacter termitidis DSM 10068 TaxID=1123282 RepID=A0A1M5Z7F6_9FIRM|nr:zinc dependent phospholipase C family protein [Sporobacter termitidis]SHI20172.1 Zinc dependent phospholipase C [Sporobacter termitidis DSM 10068]
MNKSSHILIGRLLCRRLEERHGVFLDRESFLLGSVLPDIGVSFLVRPHILRNYRRHVLKKIENLLTYDKQASAFFGRSFSLELGILCHYYADFLCFPHSSAYTGDIADHVQYEKALYRFLRGAPLEDMDAGEAVCLPQGVTADMIFDRFMALHSSYMAEEPSFFNDASKTIAACSEALVLLTGAVLAEEPGERELLFPA